jgi:hypothetical protein
MVTEGFYAMNQLATGSQVNYLVDSVENDDSVAKHKHVVQYLKLDV